MQKYPPKLYKSLNLSSWLKAAALDDGAGVACLLSANTSFFTNISEIVPRGDTFATDAWAPALDGVALPQTIVDALAAGRVAPGVPPRASNPFLPTRSLNTQTFRSRF